MIHHIDVRTKEGWWQFVDWVYPQPPVKLTLQALHTLSETEKSEYNRTRKVFHFAAAPIEIHSLKLIADDVIPLSLDNRYIPVGVRRGAIIDGIGTLGKTTTMLHIGRVFERLVRQEYPNKFTADGYEFVPVVYITLPSSCTIAKFNFALAHYFNLVPKRRITEVELTSLLIDYLNNCRTWLISRFR
jgi:hypothetical protein